MSRLPLAVLLASGALLAQGRPSFRIETVIQPEQGTLQVTCRVTGWKSGAPIYLNKGFQIQEMRLDGKAVSAAFDLTAQPLPFRDLARPLKLGAPLGNSFELRYTGTVRDWVFGVNHIGKDLVELATYASWYPQGDSLDATGLDFDVTVDLPAGYVLTTNGERVEEGAAAGRVTSRWRSLPNTGDVVLLASPAFRTVVTEMAKFRVEAIHTRLPEPLLRAEGAALAKAHGEFTEIFGQPATTGFLRQVYSPRGGWWYSRVPLIVSTEPEVLDELAKGKRDAVSSFHGDAHEVAHFWWGIADINGQEDWINEACAECSALGATTRRFGEAARLDRLRRWAKAATTAKLPILEVRSDNPERYISHYRKAPLLLAILEKRAGRAAFEGFMRAFYQAHAGGRKATTAALLDLLERRLGKASREFLAEGLAAGPLPIEAYRRELGLDFPSTL